MPQVTIYHNPACSNSRGALGLIRNSGVEPNIVEYLKTPPDRATLVRLIADMGMSVRDLLRSKEAVYKELGLDDAKWSDDQLIDFMLAHPILMNRPIVVTTRGTRLCRPPEAVLDLLPQLQQSRFAREIFGGDLSLWRELDGPICMRLNTQFNDPLDLGEEQVLDLANLLFELLKEKPSQPGEGVTTILSDHGGRPTYDVARGKLSLWSEPEGAICVKLNSKLGETVELSEDEALALANSLTQLAKES